MQPLLSSSHSGWGISSLDQDADELHLLLDHLLSDGETKVLPVPAPSPWRLLSSFPFPPSRTFPPMRLRVCVPACVRPCVCMCVCVRAPVRVSVWAYACTVASRRVICQSHLCAVPPQRTPACPLPQLILHKETSAGAHLQLQSLQNASSRACPLPFKSHLKRIVCPPPTPPFCMATCVEAASLSFRHRLPCTYAFHHPCTAF